MEPFRPTTSPHPNPLPQGEGTALEFFEQLARTRRSSRHFKADALPDGMLERLLDCANWAPSGYNLQPTHFFVVERSEDKEALHRASFKQSQILEAPVSIVFAGDTQVAGENFDRVLRMEIEAGSVNETYAALLRKVTPLMFSTAPLGMGWLWKALVEKLAKPFAPIPEFPAVHRRHWLSKQAMLCAMNFMLAANAAGLTTVPMEGFDESRVRRAVKAPKRFRVFLIVPVGYAAEGYSKVKTRLPLESKVHRVSPLAPVLMGEG